MCIRGRGGGRGGGGGGGGGGGWGGGVRNISFQENFTYVLNE